MPPVSCGAGYPTTYQYDITLICDSQEWPCQPPWHTVSRPAVRHVRNDVGMPIAYAYALAADHPDRLDRLVVSEAPLPGRSGCGVQPRRVHFIHVKSPHQNALPLVMTYGWPARSSGGSGRRLLARHAATRIITDRISLS